MCPSLDGGCIAKTFRGPAVDAAGLAVFGLKHMGPGGWKGCLVTASRFRSTVKPNGLKNRGVDVSGASDLSMRTRRANPQAALRWSFPQESAGWLTQSDVVDANGDFVQIKHNASGAHERFGEVRHGMAASAAS